MRDTAADNMRVTSMVQSNTKKQDVRCKDNLLLAIAWLRSAGGHHYGFELRLALGTQAIEQGKWRWSNCALPTFILGVNHRGEGNETLSAQRQRGEKMGVKNVTSSACSFFCEHTLHHKHARNTHAAPNTSQNTQEQRTKFCVQF